MLSKWWPGVAGCFSLPNLQIGNFGEGKKQNKKHTRQIYLFRKSLQLGHVRSLLASHHVDPNESEASWKKKWGPWTIPVDFWNISGDIHGDIHAEEELFDRKIMIPKNLWLFLFLEFTRVTWWHGFPALQSHQPAKVLTADRRWSLQCPLSWRNDQVKWPQTTSTTTWWCLFFFLGQIGSFSPK